jgi:Flp pilus assembly protein TadG
MRCRILRDQRGTIAVLGGLILAIALGVSALAVEYGRGLFRHMENQRVADLAAYSGALVYNTTGSLSLAQSAVDNMVQLNGLSSGYASSSIVASPNGDGNQAVQVVVTTSDPLYLARVLTSSTTLPVSATGVVEMKAGTPACIIALKSSGTGVSLSGGTSISAPGCAVASNNTFTQKNCGVTITTPVVGYNSGTPPFLAKGCSTFVEPPSGTPSVAYDKQTTEDPLADDPAVSTATSRLSSVEAITSPAGPPMSSGGSITFGYTQSTTESEITADGCTGSFSGSTWMVTCSGNGPFNFGNIGLAGGITVNFNTGGSSSAVYNFNGITNTGTALNFGSGTYNIAQGIYITGGGSTTSFGAGTFNIGRVASATVCSGPPSPGGGFSICMNGSSLVFGGPSTFVLAGGIWNKGGSTLTLGSGSTNSFDVGVAGDGYSLYVGGGSQTTFADATGSGDLFETAGSIASSGGSCLWISAAAQHDINGFIAVAGGMTMGAGVYTISDYIDIGGNGGGDVTCNSVLVGVFADDVTLVIGGSKIDSNCGGVTFCIGSGFSNVTITAPTSGATENLAVIGPTSSKITAGASLIEGANNTSVSGAFYFPNGPINIGGGASIGNGPGQCLELIGMQVTLSGGATLASLCSSLPVTLVGGQIVE